MLSKRFFAHFRIINHKMFDLFLKTYTFALLNNLIYETTYSKRYYKRQSEDFYPA